jgi:hypothetical protein
MDLQGLRVDDVGVRRGYTCPNEASMQCAGMDSDT